MATGAIERIWCRMGGVVSAMVLARITAAEFCRSEQESEDYASQ
jgi:hypothetical protein